MKREAIWDCTRILLLLWIMLASGCAATPTPYLNEGITPTPPDTLPELVAVLSLPDVEARLGAMTVLGHMGSEAEVAVPALVENLEYPNTAVRIRAAWALGMIGPTAQSAAPALIEVLLNDSFGESRAEAAVALGKIGDLSTVPALAQGLNDEDWRVQIASAESMMQLVPQLRSLSEVDAPKGYTLDKSGTPMIVTTIREWWKNEGQDQDWGTMTMMPTPLPVIP